MGRGWIVALAIAGIMTSAMASPAESTWHLPKPPFWPGKSKSQQTSAKKKKKSKSSVQQASAWESLQTKPMSSAKSLVSAPTNLARKVGTGTKQLYGKTKNAVAAPFRSDPEIKAPRKSTKPKKSNTSKSFLPNPFASKSTAKSKKPAKDKSDESVSEWLRQDRPGFE